MTVIRYVERNALRAKLVKKAENWKFSSLYKRLFNTQNKLLSEWPILEPQDYLSFVNIPMNKNEEDAIRYSINKGKPYGKDF